MKNFRELLMHVVLFLTACISILAVILICVFLFANGVPAMQEIGFPGFSVRNLVETGSGSIWDLPHDYRKYLCHGGCYHYWCANRTSVRYFHGTILYTRSRVVF